MSTASTPFPMVQANIALLLPAALSQDINTLWLRTFSGPMATLAAAVAAADTTILLARPAVQPLTGLTVLIDNEPIVVESVSADGLTLTVQRFAAAFPFMQMLPIQPTGTHAVGASVYLLTYETPWVYIAEKYLRPAVQADVNSLGRASVSFGTIASGSLSLVSGSSGGGTS